MLSPTPTSSSTAEAVSAWIFAIGCCGLCAMLAWLGPRGIVPGHALFGLGFIVAMEVGDRWEAAARRRAVRAMTLGLNVGRAIVGIDRSKVVRIASGLVFASASVMVTLAGTLHTHLDVPLWTVVCACGLLAGLALAMQRLVPDLRCSEPRCGHTFTRQTRQCPGCGGTLTRIVRAEKRRASW